MNLTWKFWFIDKTILCKHAGLSMVMHVSLCIRVLTQEADFYHEIGSLPVSMRNIFCWFFFTCVTVQTQPPLQCSHTPKEKKKKKTHSHTHTHTLRERLKKGRDSLYHFPKEGEDSSAIYPHKRRFFGANYQVPCKTQTIGCHTHDMEKCKVFFSFFSSAWIEDILPCHDRGGPM